MRSVGPVSKCNHCGELAVMWVDVHGLNMANHFFGGMLRKDCRSCGKQHAIGKANDEGRLPEIAAARLIAGYEMANDTDDTLNDPICVEVIRHMLGMANIETWLAREAFEIHEAHTTTPPDGAADE